MILACDLALAQQDQRLTRRQVRARRLVEQAVELIADAGELQSRQHGIERIDRFFHYLLSPRHQKPPPTTASYSARERNNDGGGDGSSTAATASRSESYEDSMYPNIAADRKRSRTSGTVAIRGRHHTPGLCSRPIPRPMCPIP